MSDEILTPSDVADYFKVSVAFVNGCARKGLWPHLAISPRRIRFTREHIEQITALISSRTSPVSVHELSGRKSRGRARL